MSGIVPPVLRAFVASEDEVTVLQDLLRLIAAHEHRDADAIVVTCDTVTPGCLSATDAPPIATTSATSN